MKRFDVNDIQLEIQSPSITIDSKLEDKIVSRIEKLGKVFPRINKCVLLLKWEKDSRDKECLAEAKVFVPGEMLFSKQHEASFEMASKKLLDDIEDQLMRSKQKLEN